MSNVPQSRRSFIAKTGQVALAAPFITRFAGAVGGGKIYKAAIIGHTGRGDYGHGYDRIFSGLENVSLEAIADVHPEGLKKAAERSGAKRQYQDFHEMLEKERPELVSIAPRVPEKHREMALAAIAVGAHLLIEKPMTEHLDEADEIVAAAEKTGVKVAVAHTRRFTTDFVKIKRLLEEDFLGTVLDVRIEGKQDSRAGGEDLIVLGTHAFDIMRWYFEDPLQCYATVTADGKPISREDVRKGREPILVAGDTIRAMFAFPKQVGCAWYSTRTADEWNRSPKGYERWGFTIHGTKGMIAHQSTVGTSYSEFPHLLQPKKTPEWKPLPDPKRWPIEKHESHLIRNLIHAIENDVEPLCNGKDGRWAVEMVSGVYESERMGGPVKFPLKERKNPLLRF